MFALGATLLYTGNMRSIKSMYDTQSFDIDERELEKHMKEFEGRYGEKTPKLVECVKKMLSLSESKRPTFTELKEQYCTDVDLRDKTEGAYDYEVIEDPFKRQQEERRRQIEEQKRKMTQKELEALHYEKISQHPIHGGLFGKQMQRGKKRYGHSGVNHGTLSLKQAKILDSMDYVHPRNNQYLNKNLDFQ